MKIHPELILVLSNAYFSSCSAWRMLNRTTSTSAISERDEEYSKWMCFDYSDTASVDCSD
jgi:hypothetical protein